VLADDHEMVREGLISLLRHEPGIHVVAAVASAREALETIAAADPDVAVLDYRLPDARAPEVCREIAERRLRARVVVLSAYLHEEAVHASLMAGACAYVVKDVEGDQLRRAIRVAARGGALIDPLVAERVIHWATRVSPPAGVLTPALLRVLRLVSRGCSNEEIARTTGLAPYTVEKYLSRIYRRLGVSGRAAAAAEAFRRGIA
jgi:two-component system response regulator DevR